MGANKPMMTRTFICFLVSSLVFNVVQSKEYSDAANQGYSVALPYGASPSSPPSPSSVSSNGGEELQSAAQYQQAAYSGPAVNSVASSAYANGPISVADQAKTYSNYGLVQQSTPPQVQQQPQSQQSLQQSIQSLQPIYQLLNYGQSHQSQLNYDQTQQPQQQQQQQQQHPQLPVQQSQMNYGAVVDNGDYNGVKTALNSQNAQSAPGAPKKTVILAIPVKLALQAAENKGSYDDKQQAQQAQQPSQQAQQPVQQSQQQSTPQQTQQTYSGPGPSISYATPNYQSPRQYDGVKGYGDHGNDQKNNEYRVNSPVYNAQSSYGQSGQSYDNSNSNSQSYASAPSTSSSGGKSSYNRDSNQYDQPKYENKNNGGSAYNGNNPYVQMKESNYMGTKGKSSQSNSNENQSDSGYSGKDSSSENSGFDEESYEGNKGGDSYKGSDSYKGNNNPNNYGSNKDDSYPSPPESMSGYDDDNDDDSSSYSKGSKGYPGSKSKSPSYSSDSDSSYGKQKGNDYPSLTSSYDADQDDWQSGYSGSLGSSKGRGRGKGGIKGSNNYKFDLSSYSGDDSSSYSGDDSDGKPDTDAIKAALANYGSLKNKIRDSNSGSSGLKVLNDYSSLKNYESLKDLSSLSFGSDSKGYGGIKSLSDFSFKDLSTSMKDLSSLKDYASLTKERPKKIKLSSYDSSDSLEDYDSGSSSALSSGLSSYSSGSDSPMSGYSGLSSYDSSSLSLSSEPYSGSSSLSSLRPSKYSSSLGSSSLGSLGDSTYDSLSSGQSYGSSGLSSISSDSSYDIASLSSSPSVAHTSTSGSSYGSSEVLSSLSKMPSSSSFSPTTFTVSDAVNGPESVSSFSTYSSPSASLSSSYLSPSGSAADVGSSSISAASGLPLSFSNTDSYGSSPSLDLSSLYGSMMKSFSSPLYSPSSQPRPLTFPGSIYPQQQPPMPIQVINTYTSGPAFPPPPHYGFMYGKPGNKPYHPRPHPPPPPPKYMQNEPQQRPRRFPTVTSPLSLYKGLQGLSSISSPGKFSASSILSSLYASGSSPAKFVIKTNGKGSGLLSSLRLTSSPTSSFSSSSSSSPPSQSSNKKPSFTSPFRLDNIFGQIYKLL